MAWPETWKFFFPQDRTYGDPVMVCTVCGAKFLFSSGHVLCQDIPSKVN